MKVAIYARVSTTQQEYENQLEQLRDYCNKQGWEIYKEYTETISGKESQRPVDAILVWALDRFTREGTEKVWLYLTQLKSWGVGFISYTEPYFRTENELVRDVLFSIMGALAKQERLRISERTKAGLERARKLGKKLGKPEIPQKLKEEIIKLREQGLSYREICERVYYWDKSRNKHFVSLGFVHKTLSENSTKKLRK